MIRDCMRKVLWEKINKIFFWTIEASKPISARIYNSISDTMYLGTVAQNPFFLRVVRLFP